MRIAFRHVRTASIIFLVCLLKDKISMFRGSVICLELCINNLRASTFGMCIEGKYIALSGAPEQNRNSPPKRIGGVYNHSHGGTVLDEKMVNCSFNFRFFYRLDLLIGGLGKPIDKVI
ncbi:hypothetical protein CDAR_221731 [Caerostris darwini]|uniref:Secreted protein n=1 Tax=Caerostris darwini TaxID=1538125 RepID=A0AAV4WMH9_9ARAC|nr:hypothetical protein CDAR_221731 [Caerostris darwini]